MPVKTSRRFFVPILCAALGAATLLPASGAAGDKPLTFADLMKFRTVEAPSISEDGRFIAYGLKPDRGDGVAVFRATVGEKEYTIERGANPRVASDSRWAAAVIEPSLAEKEKAKKKGKKDGARKSKKDEPKKGLVLLDLKDGSRIDFERVESFAFSEDGRWLVRKHFREEKDEPEKKAPEKEGEGEKPEAGEGEKDKEEEDEKKLGAKLVLRHLESGEELTLEHVKEYAFDKPSAYLACVVSAPKGAGNGVYLRQLKRGTPEKVLHQEEKGHYTHLTWSEGGKDKRRSLLAFVAATDEDGEPGDATLQVFTGRGEARQVASKVEAPEGFTLPSKNELRWSRDGQRLFFGFKPEEENEEKDEGDEEGAEDFDPYDLESLVLERELDVWHWNDPLIQTHQRERWDNEKDRSYAAVWHRESNRVVALADLERRQLLPTDNPRHALTLADVPYLKEVTWEGQLRDLYVTDLESGEHHLVAKRVSAGFTRSLSPQGSYVLFYDYRNGEGHWYLYDTEARVAKNKTAGLGVPFANEDHDYPTPPGGYGVAEWLEDESAVLIYDKFDIWRIPTDESSPTNLTGGQGRKEGYVFRVLDLDPKEKSLKADAPLLLNAYSDPRKYDAFYTASLSSRQPRVTPLYETEGHRLELIARAEAKDRLLFTRESYREFPDLWAADLEEKDGLVALGEPRKLSDVNPQIAEFAWGEAELVEWRSLDGIPLQGVLIKPGNYQPGKRYPVLVYYYRFFSQRLHQFNEPVVNHRPSFPLYASNGYAVFLPDIRFEIGRPGFSATKCLVPGVQKLIDMGIADPGAIGLHGHSWSGYQTAFVITQTHMFRAAVAGAPVSNMTSAYSGIRWGTGIARQFQYEKTQSRIGGSLWEYPERYIENSPVFFADKIETPLLIQFGDEDGAVPWTQGIELYLAMRRLGKDCIFLQYRGEPHHLKKYPNKLDYAVKMKEYFDHHLKGGPEPEWMSRGVPYQGD